MRVFRQVRKYGKAIGCLLRGVRGFGEGACIALSAELAFPSRIILEKGAMLESHARLCANGEGAVIRIGAYTTIHPYALLKANGGTIKIGEMSSVNDYAVLHARGDIVIGRDVHIASHVLIYAAEHDYNLLGRPDFSVAIAGKGVTIGNSVWIGANVVILDGVTIGEGAVIGAGAVVTRDIGPYSVAVGVPARVVKKRVQA